MTPVVHIITCATSADLFGSVLTFKTLRTGFPTAQVFVIDNASVLEAKPDLRAAAEMAGARFVELRERAMHSVLIEQILRAKGSGAVVFLDPDICLWENVEAWQFGEALMAGRLIPRFRCELTRTITEPRLHTSHLWIPDVAELLREIDSTRKRFPFFQPFIPSMFRSGDEWVYLDCAASLYAALGSRARAFSERELEAYDHLFCGSHLDFTSRSTDAAAIATLHAEVKRDHRSLKGAWRMQDEYFRTRATGEVVGLPRTGTR